MTWLRVGKPNRGDEGDQRDPAKPREVERRKASGVKESARDRGQPRPKLRDLFHGLLLHSKFKAPTVSSNDGPS